ncbi:hypothetical protein ABEV73_13240, partial [Geobacillus stearothermophilus]
YFTHTLFHLMMAPFSSYEWVEAKQLKRLTRAAKAANNEGWNFFIERGESDAFIRHAGHYAGVRSVGGVR